MIPGTYTAHTIPQDPHTTMPTRIHTVPQRRHTMILTTERTEAPRLE